MCGTVKVKELMLSESAGCFSSMHTSSSKWHIGRLARRIVAKSMKRQSRIGLGGHGGILACQNSSWRLLSCSNWGRRLGTLKRRRNAASGDTGIVEMATINVVWQFLWQHFQTLETLTNRCNSSLAFNSENKKEDYLEHTLSIEKSAEIFSMWRGCGVSHTLFNLCFYKVVAMETMEYIVFVHHDLYIAWEQIWPLTEKKKN